MPNSLIFSTQFFFKDFQYGINGERPLLGILLLFSRTVSGDMFCLGQFCSFAQVFYIFKSSVIQNPPYCQPPSHSQITQSGNTIVQHTCSSFCMQQNFHHSWKYLLQRAPWVVWVWLILHSEKPLVPGHTQQAIPNPSHCFPHHSPFCCKTYLQMHPHTSYFSLLFCFPFAIICP